jgi:hypothetical protein
MKVRAGLQLAAAGLVSVAVSCTHVTSAPAESRTKVVTIDDASRGVGLERFHFIGRWERVRGREDGRWGGTSTRSPHFGGSVSAAIKGYRFRLYGVTGPNGGIGRLGLDEHTKFAMLDFYSARKGTHVLLYTSPSLAQGLHAIAVSVNGTHNPRSRGTYVNIDSLEVDSN